MAGGIAKTFGVLLMILGILALVAGVGGLVFGVMAADRADDGFGGTGIGADRDSQREAEGIAALSLLVGGVGLFFVVLAIILLIIGGVRSRRALVRKVQAVSSAAPVWSPK